MHIQYEPSADISRSFHLSFFFSASGRVHGEQMRPTTRVIGKELHSACLKKIPPPMCENHLKVTFGKWSQWKKQNERERREKQTSAIFSYYNNQKISMIKVLPVFPAGQCAGQEEPRTTFTSLRCLKNRLRSKGDRDTKPKSNKDVFLHWFSTDTMLQLTRQSGNEGTKSHRGTKTEQKSERKRRVMLSPL